MILLALQTLYHLSHKDIAAYFVIDHMVYLQSFDYSAFLYVLFFEMFHYNLHIGDCTFTGV